MNDRTINLLIELARLLRRYGPEEFAQLASLLRDESFASSLATILDTLALTTPQRAKSEAGARQQQSDRLVSPNLEAVQSRLLDPTAYPRVQDLVDEAHRLGANVPPSGFRSRKHAADAILVSLQSMTEEQVAEVMKNLQTGKQKDSLQEWSDIIMNRKR